MQKCCTTWRRSQSEEEDITLLLCTVHIATATAWDVLLTKRHPICVRCLGSSVRSILELVVPRGKSLRRCVETMTHVHGGALSFISDVGRDSRERRQRRRSAGGMHASCWSTAEMRKNKRSKRRGGWVGLWINTPLGSTASNLFFFSLLSSPPPPPSSLPSSSSSYFALQSKCPVLEREQASSSAVPSFTGDTVPRCLGYCCWL